MSETVICEYCQKTIKKQGVGTHKRLVHGIKIKEKTIVWEKTTPIFGDGGEVSSIRYQTAEVVKKTSTLLTKENLEKTKVNLKSTKEISEQEKIKAILEKAKKYL